MTAATEASLHCDGRLRKRPSATNRFAWVRVYQARSHVADRLVEQRRLLDELHQSIAANANDSVEVDAAVIDGSVPQVLVGMSSDAELLVLGASARRNLVELIAGSEIRACARATRVPLVVVPTALNDSRPSPR